MSGDKVSLRGLGSFGQVAAEDDPVLNYFLATDYVKRVESGDILLVLGRKGTGKTAIVRHFTENRADIVARALNLRNYPWKLHETRIDSGASPIEVYVASCRYIIVAQLAFFAVSTRYTANEASQSIIDFFTRNYGKPNLNFADLILPDCLKLDALKFEPQILGIRIFSIELGKRDNRMFGREIDALADGLLDALVNVRSENRKISLHFDELDHGLSGLDETRKAMLVGLILAARTVNQKLESKEIYSCVIYLHSDIWDSLVFSDKNNITTTHSLSLT